jgi:hypothetical protein
MKKGWFLKLSFFLFSFFSFVVGVVPKLLIFCANTNHFYYKVFVVWWF